MTPGALREQLYHATDLRISLNQKDIPFPNDPLEAVHVVYHGPLIIFAGCLKSTEYSVSHVLGELFDRFHSLFPQIEKASISKCPKY